MQHPRRSCLFRPLALPFTALLALAAPACGPMAGPGSGGTPLGDGDEEAARAQEFVRPRRVSMGGRTVELLGDMVVTSYPTPPAGAHGLGANGRHVLFLNTEGADIRPADTGSTIYGGPTCTPIERAPTSGPRTPAPPWPWRTPASACWMTTRSSRSRPTASPARSG